jgi:hypothetical protein
MSFASPPQQQQQQQQQQQRRPRQQEQGQEGGEGSEGSSSSSSLSPHQRYGRSRVGVAAAAVEGKGAFVRVCECELRGKKRRGKGGREGGYLSAVVLDGDCQAPGPPLLLLLLLRLLLPTDPPFTVANH